MSPQAVLAFPRHSLSFQGLMRPVGAAMCWRKAPCEDKDILTGECFAFQTQLWLLLFCPELACVSFQQPGMVESMEKEARSLARGETAAFLASCLAGKLASCFGEYRQEKKIGHIWLKISC